MRILSFFLPLSLFLSNKGLAQNKAESIKELFALMRPDSLVDKMYNSLLPKMTNQFMEKLGADSAARAKTAKIAQISLQISKEMSQKFRNEDLTAIYDKYFTEEEIQEYIAFYKTGAGKKMLQLQSKIQQDIYSIYLTKYMPEMQAAIKRKMEELNGQ